MFRNIFRSSAAKTTLAGTAAAITGSACFASQEATHAQCEKKEETTTVVGLLQGITASVKRMEETLGTASQSSNVATKHGIDVVLGAQWGDEGKGKLVDMLSQVSRDMHGFFQSIRMLLTLLPFFFDRNTTSVPVLPVDRMPDTQLWWTVSNTSFTCCLVEF